MFGNLILVNSFCLVPTRSKQNNCDGDQIHNHTVHICCNYVRPKQWLCTSYCMGLWYVFRTQTTHAAMHQIQPSLSFLLYVVESWKTPLPANLGIIWIILCPSLQLQYQQLLQKRLCLRKSFIKQVKQNVLRQIMIST